MKKYLLGLCALCLGANLVAMEKNENNDNASVVISSECAENYAAERLEKDFRNVVEYTNTFLCSEGKIFFFNMDGTKIHEIDTQFKPEKLSWGHYKHDKGCEYIVAGNQSYKTEIWKIKYIKDFKKVIQKKIDQTKFEYEPEDLY